MNIISRVKRKVAWQVFSKLPKNKRKIVFQSYYGRGYSDSPKAICEELRRRNSFDLYWNVKSSAEAASLPEGVKPLKLDSLSGIWHNCTAAVWVDNSRKWSFTKKGKNQFYIQTWHGFPLKRIEKDAGTEALGEAYMHSAQHDSAMADLFISNSKFLSDIYRNGFWYNGRILECGFPRNDMLKAPPDGIRKKATDYLGIDPDTKLMLYAPTFRKDCGLEVYDIDYAACRRALETRFKGKWLILAKLHPNIASRSDELNLDGINVINASHYPDINELYIACDAMISDYSSTMFDFMITEKPCFLYVNDIEAYRGDRNFYFDTSKLPYPQCADSKALCHAIESFSESELKERIHGFFSEFSICETGKASSAVADEIEKFTGSL